MNSGASSILRRRPILLWAAGVVIVVGLSAFGFIALYGLPLIKTSTVRFSYTEQGVTHDDGEVYQPLGCSGVYYLRLPRSSSALYQWFLIRRPMQRIAVGSIPRSTSLGLRYVHADQITGVNLLDAKIDDRWRVDWSSTSVRFSNQQLDVLCRFME